MDVTLVHYQRTEQSFVPTAIIHFDTRLETFEALDRTFAMTQNIEGSWSRGRVFNGTINKDHDPRIERLIPLHVVDGTVYGLRSTSMGDIAIIDGNKYELCLRGWVAM